MLSPNRLLAVLLTVLSFSLHAQPVSETLSDSLSVESVLQQAANHYSAERYEEAAEQYEWLLATQGEAFELYYNLGNAYYKSNQIALAILNYERALRIRPRDKDAAFNLALCQAFVVDNIEQLGEFMLTRWYRSLRGLATSNTWAIVALAAFFLFITFLLLYFFARKRGVKKLSFSLGVLSIVITIFTLLFSAQQYHSEAYSNQAIVFAPTVTVKSSPDQSGTDLFLLHEGTKVQVNSQLGAWSEIELSDGNVGWLETKAIERI